MLIVCPDDRYRALLRKVFIKCAVSVSSFHPHICILYLPTISTYFPGLNGDISWSYEGFTGFLMDYGLTTNDWSLLDCKIWRWTIVRLLSGSYAGGVRGVRTNPPTDQKGPKRSTQNNTLGPNTCLAHYIRPRLLVYFFSCKLTPTCISS